ncbi:MAG: AAA family ATPase [Methylobacter sp.]|uniref:ExeA family protein n=1 Tax=Methylobacter sp. TaxID=2051955 RepID=UPI0025E0B71A|nr:ExeA family protein [Methylobacter sp.]MCK9619279.1 AAA family ATPase [Methylobacter sp.]
MYNQYFHFSESPFSIATDPHFIYMSPRHQEGLAHLLYGINFGGGFVALTGEVGTGKTTLCHCLLQAIPEDVDIALILNPKLNAVELLATICDELGLIYDKNQHSLKSLIDLLNQHLLTGHANGRRTVLLIDEAQNLSMEVLEQIRLLTNLETNKTKLLQIILVGQPELKESLKRQDLRQLNQRITARYHLLPLSLNETRAYIQHRLTVCNGRPDIFKDSAIRKVYKLSSGIPRMINILCDRALLGAYSSNAHVVTPAIVSAAANETLALADKRSSYLTASLAVLFLGCIAAGSYFKIYWHKAGNPVIVNVPTVSAAIQIKPEIISQLLQPAQKEPLLIEKFNAAPVAKPKTFHDWINNPAYSLNAALISTLKLWDKPVPESHQVDCHYVETTGLRCAFGKANWKDMLAVNHPAILEFSLSSGEKFYALLTGLGQNQSIIRFKDNATFPVADVLKYWDGYYLIVEPPPIPDAKMIRPHQTSDDVLWLRYLLNTIDRKTEAVQQPRFYDDKLVARVMDFQRQRQLPEDGRVGDKTMPHLKNIAHALNLPHLEISD